MGRPFKRHADEHALMERWGDWTARIRAYGERSSTPEGRLSEECEGALQSSVVPSSRPPLPGWARLGTPARIQRVDQAVAEMPLRLQVIAWAVYVDRLRPSEIRKQSGMEADEYREAVDAILVTVKWAGYGVVPAREMNSEKSLTM